jgi:uncharacterized protein involved in response to NO
MNKTKQAAHEDNHKNQILGVLFALSFRPFFLIAGITAIILIGIWLLILNNIYIPNAYFSPLMWHQHEMLFGYTAAVIAGFLLTAAQNWTGIRGLHGNALFTLCAIWLLARFSVLVLPPSLELMVTIIDLLFFPLLAYHLGRQVIQAKKLHNMIFVPILLCFTIANGLMHLEALEIATTGQIGYSLGLWLCVFLMIIIGGRIIPFFTSNVFPNLNIRKNRIVEIVSISSLLLLIVFDLFNIKDIRNIFALVAFISHLIRFLSWQPWSTLGSPILWILHSGYAWIIIGFGLTALETITLTSHSLASHAFAVGGVGCLTLGMMSRVALGHTGRPILPPRIMTLAFIFINLAALFRVFGTMIFTSAISSMISVSAVCWLVAFAIFIYKYTPVLIAPRIDGKEG